MQRQFRIGQDQIILIDGRPVGHLGVETNADFIELRMIALLPKVQRRGLGTALVRMLLEAARSPRKSVMLWVTDWNEAAVKLYHRLGFRIERSQDDPDNRVRKLLMLAEPVD
jgi:ribosomal protein S18 acetylase RimI-like enzyme